MQARYSFILVFALVAPALAADTPSPATAIPNFELRDYRGAVRKLTDWQDRKLVAVVFLGVDCPLAKLYAARLVELSREFEARGVAFLGINSNQHDSPIEIARFARTHGLPFPILIDTDHTVADCFGAERTPEVFLLDEHRVVRYRGRIDDQYTVNGRRAIPSRRDLAIALEELLAGVAVTTPRTPVTGCSIDRLSPSSATERVTYSRDIAPIVQQRCVVCHRPGRIAPFALTTYKQASAWAPTIREVVREGLMPPWHADPRYGKFANDARLTDRERQLIDDWVEAGYPEGDPADCPPPVTFPSGWSIPGPDQVVAMPQPFTVPAEGVVEYQTFAVDPGFTKDKWIQAAEIRPGNRRVVHHCNVFLQPPGYDEPAEQGSLGSFCLAAAAAGTPPLLLPEGLAKRVPAGWRLVFVVHYSPIGSVQTDQTSIGLTFADPARVKKEVATKLVRADDLLIPPRVADHRVERTHTFTEDVSLLAFFPHMHLRGKSFRYEVVYPDGVREVLLDVPRYDFAWQNRYVLAEPKRLPAGATLHCIAYFDNSADNPVNPDPDATVRAGRQSWDEMFNGYFEWVQANQDLTRQPLGDTLLAMVRTIFRPVLALVVVSVGGAFLLVNRWRRSRGCSSRTRP